jgi:predicted dehydrogenase
MSVSQVASGEENNLTLRVYGSEGSLAWRQESPNELLLMPREGERRLLTRGSAAAGPAAAASTLLPPGHPEGFHEAFANLYRGFLDDLAARRRGVPLPGPDYPTLREGARGVAFVAACQTSARAGGAWTSL